MADGGQFEKSKDRHSSATVQLLVTKSGMVTQVEPLNIVDH